jgi:adenylate cyclase
MTSPTRKLAAILAADVVGYSRLIAEDEARTLDALRALRRESFEPLVAEHRGEVVKRMGDGWLVSFASVVDAAACAIAVQERLAGHDRIKLRIGVHLGDIVHEDEDIYGDGVNIAARLQEVAEPGGVMISGTAYESVIGRLDRSFADAGERSLKNISRPVRAWRWNLATASTGAAVTMSERSSLPDKPSIAILPFANMSNDPDQEFLADGIVEDLSNALSRFRSLFVIARTSTLAYKGAQINIAQVAKELGVRYLVEGSVRKSGNRVRVVSSVIDALSGTKFASDRVDGELEDVFELQDRIVERLVSLVAPGIAANELEQARRRPSENLGAWEHFQRGLNFSNQTNAESYRQAAVHYAEALCLDPSFAAPLAQRAYDAFTIVRMGLASNSEDAIATATEDANRAIAIDPSDALAYTARARLHLYCGNAEMAVQDCNAALHLNPNFARASANLGYIYINCLDDLETGLFHVEQAIRRNPRDGGGWAHFVNKATALSRLGQHDAAILAAQEACRAMITKPNFVPSYILAIVLAHSGNLDDAAAALRQAESLQPDLSVEFLKTTLKSHSEAALDHRISSLRKAGLRETADD